MKILGVLIIALPMMGCADPVQQCNNLKMKAWDAANARYEKEMSAYKGPAQYAGVLGPPNPGYREDAEARANIICNRVNKRS